VVLTRKGIDAMCKAYKKGRRKRRDASDDEAETSETTEGGGSTTLPLWTLRRSQTQQEDAYEEIRSSRNPRDPMWKTASAGEDDPG